MKHTKAVATILAGAALAIAAGLSAPPDSPSDPGGAPTPSRVLRKTPKPKEKMDPTWLEDLERQDRACLDRVVGHAPPPLGPELQWINGEPATWESMRGKVVVIQSWTTRTATARKTAARIADATAPFKDDNFLLLVLHTPDAAETAATYMPKLAEHARIVIDPQGFLCDGLGIYQEPVNVVVDRNGMIRFAGLKQAGLMEAIRLLLAEAADPRAMPTPMPKPTGAPTTYPRTPKQPFKDVRDMRGKPMIDLAFGQWIGEAPSLEGKVLLIDFWATWCPPCRANIPHLNQLAARYPDDLVVIGVSDERPEEVRQFMKRVEMKYALACDVKSTMAEEIRLKTIPHVLVVGADRVVRWQSHPSDLNDRTLDRIIRASKGAPRRQPCDRWVTD